MLPEDVGAASTALGPFGLLLQDILRRMAVPSYRGPTLAPSALATLIHPSPLVHGQVQRWGYAPATTRPPMRLGVGFTSPVVPDLNRPARLNTLYRYSGRPIAPVEGNPSRSFFLNPRW